LAGSLCEYSQFNSRLFSLQSLTFLQTKCRNAFRYEKQLNAELERKLELFRRTELGETISKLETLEEEKTALEERIEELEAIEEEKYELDERIEELEAIEEEKYELDERIEELEEVEEENNDLQTQVDELEKRLDENDYLQFTDKFQNSVLERWVGRNSSRYRQVKVLSLFWASDDLGVVEEISDLMGVFGHDYHFQVEWYAIPDNTPYACLHQRLLDFIRDNQSDTLLILSYHGHGGIDPVRHHMNWAA